MGGGGGRVAVPPSSGAGPSMRAGQAGPTMRAPAAALASAPPMLDDPTSPVHSFLQDYDRDPKLRQAGGSIERLQGYLHDTARAPPLAKVDYVAVADNEDGTTGEVRVTRSILPRFSLLAPPAAPPS